MKMSSDGRPWLVRDAVSGNRLSGVLWVDTDSGEWAQAEEPLRIDYVTGDCAQIVRMASEIRVNHVTLTVEIWTKKPPEIPVEVHNLRPISGAACVEAMRAMCGGGAR